MADMDRRTAGGIILGGLASLLVMPSGVLAEDQPSFESSNDLEEKVETFVKRHKKAGERTSWLAYDIKEKEPLLSINIDYPMQMASMGKPIFALALLHQVDKDKIIYTPEIKNKVEEAVAYTQGHVQGNISATWLMQRLGGPQAVQKILDENYSHIFKHTSIVEVIPTSGKTYENRASASDYARFLKALYEDRLPHSREIRKLMAKGNNRLRNDAKGVPNNTRIYNKTGSTGKVMGDMGILVPNDRDGRHPYIMIGIVERDSRDDYGTWKRQKKDIIGGVSSLVYRHLNREHRFR